MLLSLKIENYALIHHCNISFPKGFIAITGETGAGKSIMLGALALVLGQRADTNILSDKEKKCRVEAEFEINDNLRTIFEENDLDFERNSIFTREISPGGRSRCFINDTPVQLGVMRDFASYLIDIHSQSSTLKLKDKNFQLSVIDSLTQDKTVFEEYKKIYKDYQNVCKQLDDMQEFQSNFLKEYSYNEYLYNELSQADLKEEEQEELERLSELAQHSQEIKENINQSLQSFENESGSNILGLLNETNYRLNKIAKHNTQLAQLYNRIDSALIELKDIYSELSDFNENIDFDGHKTQQINERLDLIYDLQRKHNVKTVKELLDIQNSLNGKLQQTDSLQEDIKQKEILKNSYIKTLNILSEQLHLQRVKTSKDLEENLRPLLKSLAMENAVFKAEITENKEFNSFGKDSVRFLLNANKTKDNKLEEIQNVISGGELSRLMMSIKAIMADKQDLPTIIFDEIDTGISGDIASKAADIMLSIGKNHQVITITHNVQMAAKAQHQFKVYKHIVDMETHSEIKQLNQEERVQEIAKMLSNNEITVEAVANAKKLLS